jgi:succinate dehydrogenase / fumarate reductase, cytochrome b subunit
MNWLIQALTSTIGRKVIMALTGLFLILFLTVHLIGNLHLLKDDAGESFNKYAEFMGHALPIQIISVANFSFILLHIMMSIILTLRNRASRPVEYAYSRPQANSAWSSRNMGILGTIILIFLVVHLSQLWYKSKFGEMPFISYGGEEYKDLYKVTRYAFTETWIVALYVISMVGLGFHLVHGFWSAFQTMGLRHKKYTPLINGVGLAFSIIVPALFAMIPVWMYVEQMMAKG